MKGLQVKVYPKERKNAEDEAKVNKYEINLLGNDV